MTPEDQERIAAQIEQAWTLAERGVADVAALAFAQARAMVLSLADPAARRRVVGGNLAALTREREGYRDRIARKRTGDRRLVILADSLGLPRPDDKGGVDQGAERTYPMLLLDRLPQHSVDSYCQRYFTSRDVLDLLHDDPTLGAGADVVLHIGLNDCANRMFLEPERLTLDLLPAETKDRIVGFAQRYRALVLANLPSYHYVAPHDFDANLHAILELLAQRRARRVVVATIILPPIRFWGATPGIQRNFGRYNQMLMAAAAEHGAVLFDLDRHVWARQHESVLLPDGMHLALAGHHLFADEVAALLA